MNYNWLWLDGYSAVKKRRQRYEEQRRKALAEGREIPAYIPIHHGWRRRALIMLSLVFISLVADMLLR